MGNMSYCRFQNTLKDLRDCEEHIDDKLDGEEFDCRVKLIKICKDIADNYSEIGLED